MVNEVAHQKGLAVTTSTRQDHVAFPAHQELKEAISGCLLAGIQCPVWIGGVHSCSKK